MQEGGCPCRGLYLYGVGREGFKEGCQQRGGEYVMFSRLRWRGIEYLRILLLNKNYMYMRIILLLI